MGEFTKYKVVLNGTVLPNQDREETIRDLCDLFHSRPSYIEKLLQGKEIALKKEYTKSEAENICVAIRNAGAQCKLKAMREQELSILEDDFSTLSGLSGLSLSESTGHVIYCPSCQQVCDDDAVSCEYCGYNFVRKDGDEGFSFGTQDDSVTVSEVEPINESLKKPKLSRKNDIAKFIGPNADFYIGKFRGMGSFRHPKYKLTWHWPAFFAFLLWALYRKMWAVAGINIVANIILGLFTQPSFLWLVFALIWPISANYLYFRHVVKNIQTLEPGVSDEDKSSYLVSKGGVSKVALLAGIGLMFATMLFSSQMIATQMLEKYYDQQGINRGEEDQLRGDGSVLKNIGDKNSNLARTSSALNVLANGLRVVIGAGNNDATNQTIDSLVLKAENEEIRDAWGNAIVISRESQRVVFLSPGPDGEAKNDDDILQMVGY